MKPVSFILATVLASSAAAVGTYVAQPAQAEAAASANAILAEVDRRAGTFGNQTYIANMEIFKGVVYCVCGGFFFVLSLAQNKWAKSVQFNFIGYPVIAVILVLVLAHFHTQLKNYSK